MKTRHIILALLFATTLCVAKAATDVSTHRRVFEFRFPIESSRLIESYSGNSAEIARLANFIDSIASIPNGTRITGIEIMGEVSLERNEPVDAQLSIQRAAAAKNLLNQFANVPDSVICFQYGINWEGLRKFVAESLIPTKNAVLEIIDVAPSRQNNGQYSRDNRIAKLKRVDGALVWDKFERDAFPAMRRAYIEIEFTENIQPSSEPAEVSRRATTPSVIIVKSRSHVSATNDVTPFVAPASFRIKTNIVGAALSVANLAVEFDFGKHWSVNVPVYYADWHYYTGSDVRFCGLSILPELRYWPTANRKFFVALHGGAVWYDIATGGSRRFKDHDGNSPAVGGGLNVGYRLPLSSRPTNRWHIEFGIGAGFYHTRTDRYENIPDGRLLDTRRKNYVGIDGLNISISYSIPYSTK